MELDVVAKPVKSVSGKRGFEGLFLLRVISWRNTIPRLRISIGRRSKWTALPASWKSSILRAQNSFASMRDLYIKNGQGFVVTYSLTNHQTFQDIKTMKDQITRVKGTERVPILLVGNKVDLESQREVPTVEGMALAQIWGCSFVESSAKNRMNVNEVFAEIVREMNLKTHHLEQYLLLIGFLFNRNISFLPSFLLLLLLLCCVTGLHFLHSFTYPS
ncbi:RAP2C [Lepeophtheirus salmonis]|uniref:RAP2C n=1 Tax=Lepeophtheirus salmonis TaxID=72036 RepID=A0A7R8CS23_LEPSM|nr:RAP2C [Lepeophtheirus salmonis]CAF2912975.1 RAP2C [Lepeophtheirus salmonis]